jgi:hypothetical protein
MINAANRLAVIVRQQGGSYEPRHIRQHGGVTSSRSPARRLTGGRWPRRLSTSARRCVNL